MNKVLIISNNLTETEILKRVLSTARDGPFKIRHATSLKQGLVKISVEKIDAILVDLSLPDSQGLNTLDQIFAANPHIPIMTLTSLENESLSVEAVKHGAQGYLIEGFFGNNLVPQALRSVIQRKAIEENYYKEKARAEIVLNSISDAVLCTDLLGNVDYLNTAAEQMTGWSRQEAQGRPIEEVFRLINGITRQPACNPVKLVLKQDKPMGLNADTVLVRRDKTEVTIEDSASPIHDWDNIITGVVIVFHDVSAAHAMTIKMAYLAHHDFLTDLPNRLLLNDRIEQAISLAKRHNTKLTILFLDLDNFKHINDSLGHETGDKLLKSVTKRLNACVRGTDTVSRQGGDEFVLLLIDYNQEEDITLIAEKIHATLALPHSFDERELYITTSIGISVYPSDGEDPETLIKNADTAMYHAKEKGRNNYQFFSDAMNVRAVERQFIESGLRIALDKEEFILHYQPKINLETGVITGAEALLRWIHPNWGLVLPERFICIAEDCGLIVPIGRWVLREACLQGKRWLDQGLPAISIAVNISALEFCQNNFFEGVKTILKETRLDSCLLQLEITESVLMRDAETNAAILQKLKSMDIQLAVDDFGTGYSSLSYLEKFPIDVLKIDKSFLYDIESTKDNRIIVSAIIGMGNSLNLQVVAEGIETEPQLSFLKSLHCEEGQGFLLSHPLVAEEFETLLTNYSVLPEIA
ncbi:MAG: EAL domain-containing protein [Pseudomonadota bacterium]